MPQRDVRQLIGDHHRQARLIRQNIDQSAADDDRMPDRKRLNRRGQHHPAMRLHIQIRRHDQIIHHRVQHLVHRPCRGQQSPFFQTRQQIFFRLALPRTLAFERRRVLRRLLILHRRSALYQNAGQLVDLVRRRGGIIPDPRLRLEARRAGLSVLSRRALFFHVNLRRNPHLRPHVHPPAIEMNFVATHRTPDTGPRPEIRAAHIRSRTSGG